MKLGKTISGGYAPATTGGTSWMFEIEVPEGRFESIQEGEKYVLNVVVLSEEGSPISATMCSSYVDESGEVSNWGLDSDNENNRITEDELKNIREQLESNGILQKSKAAEAEHVRLTNELFALPDLDYKIIRANREKMNPEELLEDIERVHHLMETVRAKQKNISEQLDKLRIFD